MENTENKRIEAQQDKVNEFEYLWAKYIRLLDFLGESELLAVQFRSAYINELNYIEKKLELY